MGNFLQQPNASRSRDILAVLFAVLVTLGATHRTLAAELLSAEAAHAAALDGDLLLVDIRTPGEWNEDGVPASAVAITMHDADFLANLDRAIGGRKDTTIALICATGGRSAFLSGILEARGYANIVDVPEGMHGSAKGPGWLAKGLPVRAPDDPRIMGE